MQITKNPCDIDVHVQTELMHTCSNQEISELHYELATLEVYKTKLRSGFVRLTGHLLKREPLSDLLKRILSNLQSLDFDSEKSLKEFDSLVKEMEDLDDDFTQGQISQVPGLPSFNDANLSAKSSASSDSSSQEVVTSCSKIGKNLHSETQKKPDTQKQHLKSGQMDREASQEEDMYGVENTRRNTDLVPYNLSRLRIKLMKLQTFPKEYRSMMQQLNASLEQQKIATSMNGLYKSYFDFSAKYSGVDPDCMRGLFQSSLHVFCSPRSLTYRIHVPVYTSDEYFVLTPSLREYQRFCCPP